MRDARLAILLKRELSQRVHHLDVPQSIKNGVARGGDALCELNGTERAQGATYSLQLVKALRTPAAASASSWEKSRFVSCR